jgi:arabinose-5-phosphate isomerase
MGDALALALLKARNFTKEDFAQLHPGGFLGRRLLKHVSEYHHTGDEVPLVGAEATLSEMMLMMSSKRLGCVLMKDESGMVGGIFCDGDLRRLAEKVGDRELFKLRAGDVMIRNPKTIQQDAILDSALALMEKNGITQLPTVDRDGHLTGVIHIHDILKSKLV